MQADVQSFTFNSQRADIAISRFGVMFFEDPVGRLKIFAQLSNQAVSLGLCVGRLEANEFFMRL